MLEDGKRLREEFYQSLGKQLIATTAKVIAFAGRNKSELILLGCIEMLLNV